MGKITNLSYYRRDKFSLSDGEGLGDWGSSQSYVVTRHELTGETSDGSRLDSSFNKGLTPKVELKNKARDKEVMGIEGVADEVVEAWKEDLNGQVCLYACRPKNGNVFFDSGSPVIIAYASSVNVFGNYDDGSDILKIAERISKDIRRLLD